MATTALVEEHVYLLARTPLEEYLDFLAAECPESRSADRAELVAEWQAADACIQQLAQSEPNWADHAPIAPLPRALQLFAALVQADPIYQSAFAPVPAKLGMVEIDRLIVRQKTINLVHVQRLREQLGPAHDPETIFRLCMPFDHPVVPHAVRKVSENTFEFTSASNDIRALESRVFRQEQLKAFQTCGSVAGVAGVVVGYGSNYLNVVAAQGRLVLNNGSHRVFALRQCGVTHIPCVVQDTHTPEQFKAAAVGSLQRSPDVYLCQPRPPVVKDYFDPRLCKILRLPRTTRRVRVRLTVDISDVPVGT